ncbi:MAG: response regulator [Verrucomicrobiota bacterium]
MFKTAKSSQPLVLLVEDQNIIRKTVGKFIRKLHYRVVEAANGEEGLRLAGEEKPDAIVSDIEMPIMDGWAMTRRLRVMKDFAFTPIILLSSLEKSADRAKSFKAGADDFVNKEHFQGELEFRLTKCLAAARVHERCLRLEMRNMEKNSRRAVADFSGNLEEFRLPSLITICRMEESSGVLAIQNKTGERGLIYLSGGEVISAKSVGAEFRKNEAAITHMLGWTAGTFSLDHEIETEALPKEIFTSTDSLLLTAATNYDETPVPAECMQTTGS